MAVAIASEHAETIVRFNAESGELPEGVTVDSAGNVYVSLSPLGQLVKFAPGSAEAKPFGAVSGLQEGDIGLIGLAVDHADNVYGAVQSANPDASGVWQFDATTGAEQRVPGTEAVTFPNSIAFGADGTMYVTDTILGAVWRVPAGGSAEPWIVDPLLEGDGSAGFPFPLGANGIAVGDGVIYVGVTEAATIVAVPVQADGAAGEPVVRAAVGDPVDGIAVDAAGNIYVAAPLSGSVLRVDPTGSVETVATAEDGLDAPTSVAFGPDENGRQILYVVNFSVAVAPPGGAGPALLKITLGSSPMEQSSTAQQEPAVLPTTGSGPVSFTMSLAVATFGLLIAGASVLIHRRTLQ